MKFGMGDNIGQKITERVSNGYGHFFTYQTDQPNPTDTEDTDNPHLINQLHSVADHSFCRMHTRPISQCRQGWHHKKAG